VSLHSIEWPSSSSTRHIDIAIGYCVRISVTLISIFEHYLIESVNVIVNKGKFGHRARRHQVRLTFIITVLIGVCLRRPMRATSVVALLIFR